MNEAGNIGVRGHLSDQAGSLDVDVVKREVFSLVISPGEVVDGVRVLEAFVDLIRITGIPFL